MLLIIGIDGASWEVVDRWISAGELPFLGALRQAASWGRARSTVPAATFPAWTSFATAAEPGEHGIFDFSVRHGYSIRFVSARDRGVESIWHRLAQAGLRVCVYNLPASFPPEPLPGGVFISGFDTPVATAIDPSFVQPRELHAELTRRFGPLVISDLNEARIGAGWHARALETLVTDVGRRAEIALDLLGRAPWDVFFVLFGESDTGGHHFWMYSDHASPRFAPSPFERGLLEVYRAIDDAAGRLAGAAPAGTTTLVLSDHGMGGAGTRAVALNRHLEDCGLLRFTPRKAHLGGRALRAAALRLTPRRLQGSLARGFAAPLAARLEASSRFAGIDWPHTRAFSEELNYFPSVWINLDGREPLGSVAGSDYALTCDEVAAGLRAWRDPATGWPIVREVWHRSELYGDGPLVERAPDLVVDLALEEGYSSTVARSRGCSGPSVWRIGRSEHRGAKGQGMNGTHRPLGLYAWSGPGIAAGSGPDLSLSDLGGQVLEFFSLARTPGVPPPCRTETDEGNAYSAAEETRLAARLRSLGYLE
ncbi:MAG TPA: alkaline phosphatase family protein [Candidatus Bathyarchaeia archaeon]|nr:alkaline phosphatase family protein [Candidatus Bathyarchaeia archaeon]